MFLPAAMPSGALSWASGLVVEAGLLGFVLHALVRGETSPSFAALVSLGVLLFLARVARMLRHPRRAPAELRRPDWGMAHALSALVCLSLCVGLGLYLAWAEPSDRTLQLAKVYGFLGLVGFLSQMVIGVGARLLPMGAWLWSFAEGGYRDLPASQYESPARGVQAAGFASWTLGLPLLAWGLHGDHAVPVSAGAALLLLTTLGALANGALVLRRSRKRSPPPR
jgi:hypothetical protein